MTSAEESQYVTGVLLFVCSNGLCSPLSRDEEQRSFLSVMSGTLRPDKQNAAVPWLDSIILALEHAKYPPGASSDAGYSRVCR